MINRYFEWSMFVLRIVLGIIFLTHGLQKISGFEGIVKFFGSLGLPVIMAYIVTTIETVGGAFLILGLFPRLAATGIGFVLLGAIMTVKLNKGLVGGYEFELSLLSAAIALALSGSQFLSLGNYISSFKTSSARKKIS